MELAGAGFSHDLNLASGRAALIGTVHGAARFELRDGFHRKLEAKIQLLKLVIDTSGIHTVDVKVIVFLERPAKRIWSSVLPASSMAPGTCDSRRSKLLPSIGSSFNCSP